MITEKRMSDDILNREEHSGKEEMAKQVVKIVLQDIRRMSGSGEKKAIELQLLEFKLKEFISDEVYQELTDLIEEYFQMIQQKKLLELEIVKLRSHVGEIDVQMIRIISKKEQAILSSSL
ncbi:hypothetical protein [Risungbinella massiliensis]|uniref:hypothetical protein n=1 Tax=Risungbinella massiliensis TaxID=1329796 RepID=UPI0005CC5BB4|nr:hypothetical protein [Risungbinella massiliensis]